MTELKPCPFCGGEILYEVYHELDGFTTPFMFCNWCKCLFTSEGIEDFVTDKNDGFDELREAWNRRANDA